MVTPSGRHGGATHERSVGDRGDARRGKRPGTYGREKIHMGDGGPAENTSST